MTEGKRYIMFEEHELRECLFCDSGDVELWYGLALFCDSGDVELWYGLAGNHGSCFVACKECGAVSLYCDTQDAIS